MMNTRFACAFLTLALVASLPLSALATPPLNTPCRIELRRDATGAISDKLVVRVALTGKIKSVDNEWICLDSDEGTEVWIPIPSIQYIALVKPPAR